MPQNINQLTATGSYSDGSTRDITAQVAWTVSDTSIATVNASTGQVTIQPAGQIWGATVGVTATLAPGTPGTASLIVVASDSGSVAPLMPLDDTQWAALGLSPWGSYWGLQEPSGSFLISSGSTTVSLTASVSAGAGLGPQLQSTQPGWLRKFIVMTGSAGMNMSFPVGSGPSMASSIAFLGYASIDQMGPAFTTIIGTMRSNAFNVGNISYDTLQANSGMLAAEFNTQQKRLAGPHNPIMNDRVHPLLVVINTSSFTVLAASDLGVITSASNAASWNFNSDSNAKGFGSTATRCVSGSYCYFAVCTGSTAESLSDPQAAAALLQKLGWSVDWATCPVDSGTIKLPFMPHHWRQLGLTPWTATWNMQETATPQLTTNDSWAAVNWNGWCGTFASVDTFQYKLSNGYTGGWTRGGVQQIASNQRRISVSNVKVDPAFLWDQTGSFACLLYVAQSSTPVNVALNKAIISMGPIGTDKGPATVAAVALSGGLPAIYCSGSTVTGSSALADNKVHPVMLVYDRTNSRVKLYTDIEKITGSFQTIQIMTSATSSLFFGGYTNPWGTQAAASGVYVYASFTTGALAESYSTDGVASNFLKTLGWSVGW